MPILTLCHLGIIYRAMLSEFLSLALVLVLKITSGFLACSAKAGKAKTKIA